MKINVLRFLIVALNVILVAHSSKALTPPPPKPLCEVVSLAELIVIGEQKKCRITGTQDPSLQLGPNTTAEIEIQETLYGVPPYQHTTVNVSTYCLEEKRQYILLLRHPIDKYPYIRAYGFNDILKVDQKEEVLECIKKLRR